MAINIVLVEPEIPQNTGATGRLCVALDARLHLIRPLGFRLTGAAIRRSGLDYWEHVRLGVHPSWEAFLETERPTELFLFSARATRSLFTCRFSGGPDVFLVFGGETRGLPASLLERHADRVFAIPMPGLHARSINLATAVAVAAYECHRQLGERLQR